ncbi:MAG TPA: hypothetical protein VHY58_22960 [Streptosporangiaceae bacterium]|nr:hypothetical protein [Streptosporangiaceae bacterium]
MLAVTAVAAALTALAGRRGTAPASQGPEGDGAQEGEQPGAFG